MPPELLSEQLGPEDENRTFSKVNDTVGSPETLPAEIKAKELQEVESFFQRNGVPAHLQEWYTREVSFPGSSSIDYQELFFKLESKEEVMDLAASLSGFRIWLVNHLQAQKVREQANAVVA